MTNNELITKLIQEGDERLQEGDFEAAEKKYREAFALDHSSADALSSIGAVYSHRGDQQTALEWAKRAIAADPNFKPAHGLLGNVLLGLNRYEEALEELVLSEKSNLRAYGQIGLCYEKLERWEEAEKNFRAVLEKDPAYMTRYSNIAYYNHNPFPADVHHALARVLQRQGKNEEAMLHYHLAKRIDPTIPLDPMYLEIMKESDLENHPSEKYLNRIHKPSVEAEPVEKLKYLFSLSEYPTLCRAIEEYKSEDFISFIKDMIYAFQQNGKFFHSAHGRVIIDILYEKEPVDLFEALQTPSFKRLFELAEMVHAGKISLGDSLKEDLEFDWRNANLLVDLTDRFIKIEPKTGVILTHIVECVLSKSPNKSDSGSGKVLLGQAYYYTNRLEKAVDTFQKAFELFKLANNPEGMLNSLDKLGDINMNQGNFPTALNIFDTYISLAESQGKTTDAIFARYNRGRALFMVGKVEECYEEGLKIAYMIRNSVAIENDFRDVLLNLLTHVAEKIGKSIPDDVLESLRYESSSEEESVKNLRSKAMIAQENGELDKALSLLEKAYVIGKNRRKDVIQLNTDIGLILGKMGRLTEAMEKLKLALWDAEPISVEVDVWTILLNLGNLADRLDEKEEAITYLERALKEARQKHSYDQEGQCLLRLMQILNHIDPIKANEYLREIEKNFPDFVPSAKPHEEDLPQNWIQGMASLHFNPKGKEETLTQMFKIWEEEIQDIEIKCKEGLRFAEIAAKMGEFTYSEIVLKKILSIATSDEWRNINDEMKARITLGKIYRQTSRYIEALEQYKKALTIAQFLKDERDEGIIRGWMGIVYRFLDELDAAVEQYELAININERYQNSPRAAENRMNLASSLFLLGRNEEGKKNALEALAAFDSEGLEELASHVLGMLIEHFEREELPPELQERIEKFIDDNWKSSNPFIVGLIWPKHAKWLASQGDFENSQVIMEKVIDMYRNNGDIFNQATASLMKAYIFQDHDIIMAIDDATKARDLAASIGQLNLVLDCHEFLLFAAMKERNEEDVKNYLEAVIKGWIKLRRRLKSDRDRMKFSERIGNIARQCTTYFLQKGQIAHAFEMQEWGRAQALTDLITGSVNTSTQSDKKEVRDLLANESEILNSMQREAQMIIDGSKNDGNSELENKKEAELDVVYDALRVYDPQYVQIKKGIPVNIARVQTLLSTFKRPAVIVTFGFVGDEIIAMTLRQDQITPSLYRTGMERVQVEAMLKAFKEEIHLYQGKGFIKTWQDKGALLLRGLSEDIHENDFVVLVPEGHLQEIPIHALRLPNGKLLVEHASIVYTPSLTVLESLQMTEYEKPQSQKGTFLFSWDKIPGNDNKRLIEYLNMDLSFLNRHFGIEWAKKAKFEKTDNGNTIKISAGKNFIYLRLNDEKTKVQLEIDDIRCEEFFVDEENGELNVYKRSMLQALRMKDDKKVSRFTSVGVTFQDEARAVSICFANIGHVISGNNLDKDKIKESIYNSDILHFSCHGYFDPDNYLESGLILRVMEMPTQKPLQKEILSLRDIMTWHLDCELVVLSACETGRGTMAPSEFLGLSRGFLAAGAQSVIVALWKIENSATQAFMLTFYKKLQRQLEKSDIIDVAFTLKETQCEYAKLYDLYDWAGFKLIGQPTIRWKGVKN